MTTQYIAYIITPPKKGSVQSYFTTSELSVQEKNIQAFLKENPGLLVDTFVEVSANNRHRNRWPQLLLALKACQKHGAQLIIGQIRNLTHNETFTDILLHAITPKGSTPPLTFYCLDQPFINKDNLLAIVKYSKVQREYHGEVIKEGIKRSGILGGNPNGKQTLAKANRPQHDNGVIFSLMMMPVIHDYKQKGLSQRKMLEKLEEEGFKAFKGGKWCLSQLQKLIARIKVNESALSLENKLGQFFEQDLSHEQIAMQLNESNIKCPQDGLWDAKKVEEVIARLNQIKNIMAFNELILKLSNHLEDYTIDEVTDPMLIQALEKIGINLPRQWLN